jgi:hypothetical protein
MCDGSFAKVDDVAKSKREFHLGNSTTCHCAAMTRWKLLTNEW